LRFVGNRDRKGIRGENESHGVNSVEAWTPALSLFFMPDEAAKGPRNASLWGQSLSTSRLGGPELVV